MNDIEKAISYIQNMDLSVFTDKKEACEAVEFITARLSHTTATEFLQKVKVICKEFEDVDGYKLCDICPASHLCGGIENIADEVKLIQAVMDYKEGVE